MTLQLRKLTPDDAEAYVQLRSLMLAQEPFAYLASPGEDSASRVETVRERLASPESAIFGAFAPALVGAVGIFRPAPRKAAHQIGVWGMFVVPEHRRSGVGRRLMLEAIEHARQLPDVDQVTLSVSETAEAARRLYESLGFRVWGTEPRAIRHEGTLVSEHHMTLLLT